MLAVSQSWSLLLEATHIPSHGFPVAPSSNSKWGPFHDSDLPILLQTHLFNSQRQKVLCFKTGPNQKIQDNLPILTLLTPAKSPLPCYTCKDSGDHRMNILFGEGPLCLQQTQTLCKALNSVPKENFSFLQRSM